VSDAGARVAALATGSVVGLALLLGSGMTAVASWLPAQEPTKPSHILVLGVAGLTWDDVDPATTPTLAALAATSTDGTVLVRGVRQRGCAADGWLALGTGVRTLAPRPTDPRGVEVCPQLPQPRPAADGASVPLDAAAVTSLNDAYYQPRLGNVGDSLQAAGVCSTAVGPGAALMVMTSQLHVDHYLPTANALTRATVTQCPLTVVDLGQVPARPQPPGHPPLVAADGSGAAPVAGDHASGLAVVDRTVARLLALAPPQTTVVLTSVADEAWDPHLRVLTIRGLGPSGTHYGPGLLWVPSTRQPGLAQLPDVTAFVLDSLQVTASSPVVGTAPQPRAVPTGTSPAAIVDELARMDLRAQAIRIASYSVTQGFAYALALLLIAAVGQWWWLRRLPGPRRTDLTRRIITPWQIAFIYLAACPVATFLANLFPWDRAGSPDAAASRIVMISLAAAALLSALALAGPWRRQPLGPSLVVAAVTVAVLGVDVMTGSRLQFASLFGLSPLVGGRFYGLGNVAFSLFAVAAVFVAVGLAGAALRAERRRLAAAVTLGWGLAVAHVDGWPRFGADLGGMIAITAAFVTMAAIMPRLRWTLLRVAGVAAVAIAVPAVIAVLDWLRPAASRSHLGDFVQSVIDGSAGETIRRKAEANLASFGDFLLAPLTPVVAVVFAVVVIAPERVRATWVTRSYRLVPALRAGLVAVVVLAVVGFLVNDSGLIVTEVVMLLAVPLGTATVVAAARTTPPPRAPTTPAAPPLPAPAP
jgi:hypothetical protein